MALSKIFGRQVVFTKNISVERKCIPVALQAYRYNSATQAKVHESKILESICTPLPSIKDVKIQDLIRSKFGRWGNQVGYECGVTGLKYTHDEVVKLCRSFGSSLLEAGLKRGDIVAIVLPNCPQYPVIVNALIETGITATLLSPAYTPSELKSMIALSKAKGVVTIPEFVPIFKGIQSEAEGQALKTIISLGPAADGCHSYSDMVKTSSEGVELLVGPPLNTREEVALILWSSGTTGLPKGVMLTHENVVCQVLQTANPSLTKYYEGEDTLLGLIPFCHIFGEIIMMQVAPFIGAKVATMPKFDPALFVKVIKRFQPSIMHLVPPLIAFIGANPEITKEDLRRLHKVVSGGAITPSHHVKAITEKTSVPDFFYQGVYGMTELTGAATLIPVATGNTRTTSAGKPVPDTCVKIVEVDTGALLGPNQAGEVCVKGPQLMKGYFNNEEATKSFVDADGFAKTGDIGYYDEEGYLYIVDRLKEIIKVKGLQVSPSEIEDVLGKFAKVGDVAVIGVPDNKAGEVPRAYIIKRDPSLTEEEIHGFLSDKLAAHKQIRGGIKFVESIPKSPSGKILRKELVKIFNAEQDKNKG